MQHIKNTNPKMWILYGMERFYRGDFSDILPSLVLNSHTSFLVYIKDSMLILATEKSRLRISFHCLTFNCLQPFLR